MYLAGLDDSCLIIGSADWGFLHCFVKSCYAATLIAVILYVYFCMLCYSVCLYMYSLYVYATCVCMFAVVFIVYMYVYHVDWVYV